MSFLGLEVKLELTQILISGLSQGCVYGLIALGFVLIYKATEMVNFAQGDLMMLGAFVAYTFISVLEFPFTLALVTTILVMAGIGILIERFAIRPMIGEPHFSVLMITIGLGFILRAIAGFIWGNEPKSLATPYAGKVLEINNVAIGFENVVIILGTIALCLSLGLFFKTTTQGKAMQAASQNQLAASYVGISVKKVNSATWAISGGISAVAGILIAPVSLIDPQIGFIGVKAFAAAIVGGFGSLPGAIIGGLMIGVGEQFAGFYLPPGFSEVTAYAILLTMLILRPHGILTSMQIKKM